MATGLPKDAVRDIVARALAEDIGSGDLTTIGAIDADAQCRARIEVRGEGVIAGLPVARQVFLALDPRIEFGELMGDGERVSPGAVVAQLSGSTRAVLTAERTALNFLQRMSGIATLTADYVAAVQGTQTRIVDTRKTAPGLRLLDKYAVRVGGGWNHRMGLFDGILIKDNHLRAAGGVGEAVARARDAAHHLVNIEVEVQTLDEVEEAIESGADIILLDNMTLGDVRDAAGLVAGRCEVEVSGGVDLSTVRGVAECGVDYISVGALTHSASALDLALEIVDD
jgi:nicotinate-nucleotide pyrophosphorylase (carboxylating)